MAPDIHSLIWITDHICIHHTLEVVSTGQAQKYSSGLFTDTRSTLVFADVATQVPTPSVLLEHSKWPLKTVADHNGDV